MQTYTLFFKIKNIFPKIKFVFSKNAFYICITTNNNHKSKNSSMKLTIELSKNEVAAIKKYLSDTGEENVTNDDVKSYINNIVNGVLYSPKEAVSDYIYSQAN